MDNLKHHSLLLVGNEDTKLYFKNHFRDIVLVKDNNEALSLFEKKYFPIIFLFDSLDIAKKIREYSRETIIAIIADKIDKENLLKGFFIPIIGYIEKPFQKIKVEELLSYVDKEIKYFNPNVIWVKDNYSFNLNNKILYNSNHQEIKLTKKERQFLEMLLESKYKFVSTSAIEHTIWEEESVFQDCSGRLKALINSIRKKLPQKTIVNEYGIGYKIIINRATQNIPSNISL